MSALKKPEADAAAGEVASPSRVAAGRLEVPANLERALKVLRRIVEEGQGAELPKTGDAASANDDPRSGSPGSR
jgi:hypothetical protein